MHYDAGHFILLHDSRNTQKLLSNYVEYQNKFHNNPPNRFPMNQQNASETDKIPILFIL